MPTGMSDTFAFRSLPVPLRRRVNVRALKTVVALCVVAAAVGSFARWTIRSEQASFIQADRHAAAPNVGLDQGLTSASSDLGAPASGLVVSAADAQTQTVLLDTLTRARGLMLGGGSPALAGPGQLAHGSKGIIYADGPSFAPTIVSVGATHAAWGAAAMSEGGLCFALRLDARGTPNYGTISAGCTGANALQVTGASW